MCITNQFYTSLTQNLREEVKMAQYQVPTNGSRYPNHFQDTCLRRLLEVAKTAESKISREVARTVQTHNLMQSQQVSRRSSAVALAATPSVRFNPEPADDQGWEQDDIAPTVAFHTEEGEYNRPIPAAFQNQTAGNLKELFILAFFLE